MHSSKLHLKRTPAEQAEHDLKKARKATRKAAKRKRHHDVELREHDGHDHDGHGERKRRRQDADEDYYGVDDDGEEYGPQPAGSSSGSHRAHKPDYEQIQAELEEARFHEKMWGAMGDDERLDSVEASLNSYAHVPRRWRGGGMERMDDELDVDPQYMEDEDYAEWIRAGMWRKKHAVEHEEQMRRQAEQKARQEREKKISEETRRLERAVEEERRKRKRAKDQLREIEARGIYETRWKALLAPAPAHEDETLRFGDIPWPVMPAMVCPTSSGRDSTALEHFTVDAVRTFLFPDDGRDGDGAKDRKEKLRETMLRFHPDKFEGRIMKRVLVAERELVKEAVGIIARTVNTLMAEGK